jgi:hypothetical protein
MTNLGRAAALVAATVVPLAGCAGDSDPAVMSHAFPLVTVEPGLETDAICQSWTLDNDDAIYVNKIAMTNGGGLHHSNWFFVPEDLFAGPDGTWNCEDRNYDQAAATLLGGVVFAQSTQATAEELAFVDNAAYRIPPRSRIVGQLHLLNSTDGLLETGITFEVHPIRAAQAEILLSPAVFVYQKLAIPPMAASRFQTECDLERAYGAPLDFNFYYMLPHYHALGTAMDLVAVGPSGEHSVFGSGGQIGDAKSKKLDPPFDVTGTGTFKFSCSYYNPGTETVGWGNASQEMCILVMWTDSPYIIFSGALMDNALVGTEDGVEVFEGTCGASFIPNQE